MPLLIEKIVATARRVGGVILCIIFHDDLRKPFDWISLRVRMEISHWARRRLNGGETVAPPDYRRTCRLCRVLP